MKSDTKTFPFALAFAAHKCAKSFGRFDLTRTNPSLLSPRPWRQIPCTRPTAQPAEPRSIYAVDDHPRLNELYAGFLEAIGYVVRTFRLRADALTALKTDHQRPALLITDFRGFSMPVNQFIYACRSIHPSLRILMASGYGEHEIQFCRVRPDRFLQKPFTPEELQQTVRAVLAAA
jgi:CheY-like chemotaxis protein